MDFYSAGSPIQLCPAGALEGVLFGIIFQAKLKLRVAWYQNQAVLDPLHFSPAGRHLSVVPQRPFRGIALQRLAVGYDWGDAQKLAWKDLSICLAWNSSHLFGQLLVLHEMTLQTGYTQFRSSPLLTIVEYMQQRDRINMIQGQELTCLIPWWVFAVQALLKWRRAGLFCSLEEAKPQCC